LTRASYSRRGKKAEQMAERLWLKNLDWVYHLVAGSDRKCFRAKSWDVEPIERKRKESKMKEVMVLE